MYYNIMFGMAAMLFLCNGLLLNRFSLSRVNIVFNLITAKVHYYYASFPYFNFLTFMGFIFCATINFIIFCYLNCNVFHNMMFVRDTNNYAYVWVSLCTPEKGPLFPLPLSLFTVESTLLSTSYTIVLKKILT